MGNRSEAEGANANATAAAAVPAAFELTPKDLKDLNEKKLKKLKKELGSVMAKVSSSSSSASASSSSSSSSSSKERKKKRKKELKLLKKEARKEAKKEAKKKKRLRPEVAEAKALDQLDKMWDFGLFDDSTDTGDEEEPRSNSRILSPVPRGDGRTIVPASAEGMSAEAVAVLKRQLGLIVKPNGRRYRTLKSDGTPLKSPYELCRYAASECFKQGVEGGLCTAHGPGRRCRHESCSRSALTGGKCRQHGGGRRCAVRDCDAVVNQPRSVLCPKHADGIDIADAQARLRKA